MPQNHNRNQTVDCSEIALLNMSRWPAWKKQAAGEFIKSIYIDKSSKKEIKLAIESIIGKVNKGT